MLNCNRKRGDWSNQAVTCAEEKELPAHCYKKNECDPESPERWQKRDKYKDFGWAHWWGGEYKCPSGKVY